MTKLNEMAEEYADAHDEEQWDKISVWSANLSGFKAGYLAALESSEVLDMQAIIDKFNALYYSLHGHTISDQSALNNLYSDSSGALAAFRKMRADFDKESGK